MRSPFPMPPILPLSALPRDHAVLWADPGRAAAIPELAALPAVHDLSVIPAGTLTLVVAGGGDRIDRAKVFRARLAPHLKLIAVPTLWGSGAEASRVAVLNTPAGKEIHVGDELLPDAIAFPDTLIASTPEPLRRAGIGDAFSHVFEAFISPLATDEIRTAAAALLRDMLVLDDDASPDWFRLSAHACALQASSGVGLIHGIAHTLEPLGVRGPLAPGHAGLCSLFMLPVLDFDLAHSEKPATLLATAGIATADLRARFRTFFDPTAYSATLPSLQTHWRAVLTDRCSRVNGVLVRPGASEFFAEYLKRGV